MSECVDNRCVSGKISSTDGCKVIHKNLNWIIQWLQEWLTSLNRDECEVMHFGPERPNKQMCVRSLCSVAREEFDRGVILSADLKHKKWKSTCSKGNIRLSLLQEILSMGHGNPCHTCTTCVKPHLEYAVDFRFPNCKDMKVSE